MTAQKNPICGRAIDISVNRVALDKRGIQRQKANYVLRSTCHKATQTVFFLKFVFVNIVALEQSATMLMY